MVNNVKSLIEYLESEQENPIHHSGFVDMNEEKFLDEVTYRTIDSERRKSFAHKYALVNSDIVNCCISGIFIDEKGKVLQNVKIKESFL